MTKGDVVVVVAGVMTPSGRRLEAGRKVRLLGVQIGSTNALVTTRLASNPTHESTYLTTVENLRKAE